MRTEDREKLRRLADVFGAVHAENADSRFHEDDARFLRDLADSPAVGDSDRLASALEDAWLHGFVSSGEGFNGEYPFDGDVDAARVDSADEQGARDYARQALADFKEKQKGTQ